MPTECNQDCFPFHPLNRRGVRGNFDGGTISSDGGGLLLREVEKKTKIIEQFAACFRDFRDPEAVEHRVAELVGQRIYGLALGYEDLNDHDQLRCDPLFAVLVEKEDLSGEQRRRARDQGAALAGKSTLNRLELGAVKLEVKERYKKIILDDAAVDRLLVDIFLQAHREPPQEIVLDVDSTDIPLHGEQEGRFFHGYYGHYCYLPLYIVCGEYVLCARLRPSNIDGAQGSVAEVERIVEQIRQAWPQVRIILRGDSGFCREELLNWCEQHGVDYVVGLAQNAVLLRAITAASAQAAVQYEQSGKAARVFSEFVYRTQESWSRGRRVIAKAEHLEKGPNPRFVVTSLSAQETVFPLPSRWTPQSLYEEFYCVRGDMENRIKEQMMLFADRTSTAFLRSNQIRLYFSTVAYLLMQALRRWGLAGTELAKAQCNTVRLKLLKIGAQLRITVRKVWISLSAGYPYRELFRQVYQQLQQAVALRC
jgi:Transposase DDE domain group 1